MQAPTTPAFDALPATATPEQRIEALNITLPPVPDAVGDYLPWVITGNLLMTSGQLPWIDGELQFEGQVGTDLTTQQGYDAFSLSALFNNGTQQDQVIQNQIS